MTQVFAANGEAHGVTVVEAGPCVIVQVKTVARDGYEAIQLGFGSRKKVNDAQRGHFKRLGDFRFVREVRVDDASAYTVGQTLAADMFAPGEVVDVVGISKGRGFAGGIKRHHFHGGPKTHGQSDKHRSPGSIGSGTTPGRVRKGLRMAGHMGDERVTVKNLTIFEANAARSLLLIEGSVPGSIGGLVRIAKTGVTTPPKAPAPVEPEAVEEEEPVAAADEVVEETIVEEPVAEAEAEAPVAEAAEAPVAEAEAAAETKEDEA
jgi:large subunit ribosomal protein L3